MRPSGAVKHEQKGGEGEVWVSFLVVLREPCEVNTIFIKGR